ncbi:nitroreductase family protein [Bacillus sp. CGMCC 1.16607]|uniref:nitroreductase family protein n=1 Tax=Bacillus sp. CGMCC 1.16607 TaxID=3351842 RepID=UPI003639AB3E
MSISGLTTLREVMTSRKSVRKYDSSRKVTQETINKIMELATTAPSSWNLQHWKFIIVSDQKVKDRLFPIAFNQVQVTTCSHLIIILGDTKAYENAYEILSIQVEKGYMSQSAKNVQIDNILYAYHANKEKYEIHDAIRNSSLAAMQLMLAAKSFGIDSCPMLSFKEDELMKELQIPKRYLPVMMISLGYASQPAYSTVRLPVEKVILKEY